MTKLQLNSPYAPIRYRNLFWWEFARNAAQAGMVLPQGKITADLPELIMHNLCKPLIENFVKTIADNEDAGHLTGSFAARIMESRHWVPMAGQYELNGRQIFDLTDELVEMLSQTDIGDCTLNEWKAPYDAFFIRFGKQESMRLPIDDDYEYLDGAFVAVTPWDDHSGDRRIKFGFTMVGKDGNGMTLPGYYFDLTPEEQRLPLMQAIAHSTARRAQDFTEPGDDQETALNKHRLELLNDNAAIIEQAMHLIVNSLFYIESLSGKDPAGSLEPGRDVPPAQVVEWMQAKPEKRHKLKSRMFSDGYAVVRLLGKELGGTHNGTGASTKTHWRRGHWREQHHGPQNSLLKRIWIKPTMVNADKPHDDLPGHIYAVGSSNKEEPDKLH